MALGDVYKKIAGTWVLQGNIRGPSGVAGALNDLSDVSGSPSTGDVLRKTSGDWQPAALGYSDVGAAASGHTHSGYAADSHTHSAVAAPVVRVYDVAAAPLATPATWAKPTGIHHITVEMVGGGGGSGGTGSTSSSQAAASGSGGAGGYSRKVLSAAALGSAATATIIAGAAGLAATAGANDGGEGGTSSFVYNPGAGNVTINAEGGGGGVGGSGATNQVRGGGAGGPAAGGDISMTGANGMPGLVTSSTPVPTAFGPASILSGTCASTLNAGASGTGRSYGGGGGGVRANASTGNQAGNAGGAGVVIVTEYY
jgi:hypothetical protein